MARGQGRVFQRKGSKKWWIEYWVRGRQVRESSRSCRERDAVKLLNHRLGEIESGRPVGPRIERTTFEDLAKMLIDDYRVNNHKSTDRAELAVRHLQRFFGGWRAVEITSDQFSAYIRSRLEGRARAKPATVMAERAALNRMFTLGYRAGKVASRPSLPSLRVRNARQGFFEEEELKRVLDRLPEVERRIVLCLYLTGWRLREVLSLQWRQVDLDAGAVRLEPGTTKNDEGRTFPFAASPELAQLIVCQREETSRVERERGEIVTHVFHRDGRPIRSFRERWVKACEGAGCPGRMLHDLRRTAVREMERAGVPRSVAMKLTGHKTESVYARYAIVSEADLASAVERRTAYRSRTRTVPAQFGAGANRGRTESLA